MKLVVTLVLALAVAACGSDPVCGDGETDFDLGEQCDDGNSDETDVCLSSCRLRPVPQLTVKWEFNQDLTRGFQGDSCFDIDADEVNIRLVGPGVDQTDDIGCSVRQIRYQDIPSGPYTATLTLRDRAGAILLTEPYSQDITFSSGVNEEATLIVPPEQWVTAYVGSFFFRLQWGMLADSCEAAIPPVVDNSLLLLIGGVPYAGVTDVGHPLDGSAFSPCRPLSESLAQASLSVPFGPAEFTVSGRDSLGTVTFEETFETFVGVGVNNPELRFNVPALPAPDASPDA